MTERVGNIFGSARAENDSLLDATFVETAEFKNLAYTNDFHVAVGRRGTGKSAVFLKLRETLNRSKTILIEATAEEHATLTLTSTLHAVSESYEHARAVSKLLWKSAILTHIAAEIVVYRNAHLPKSSDWLREHLISFKPTARPSLYSTTISMLRAADKSSFQSLISSVATASRIDELQKFVSNWLNGDSKKAVVLLDRLDEGWTAEPTATGVLGGLTVAAVELAEAFCPIHVLAFVKDNMFRALAHYDQDFSRNIEDASLRLKWTEESLFLLITARIRVALNIEDQKDVRIWDRLAQNELKGRNGFREVLKHTLYRPRDLLNLLNTAYQNARSSSREHLILSDIDDAALTISRTRLDDLIKEYKEVLPGTIDFTQAFRGSHSPMLYAQALASLEEAVRRVSFNGLIGFPQ